MSLTTNSMPSLRQRQINEVLDYHQNMNHIVFNRTARHVAVSEQPSGEVDPSQSDIIIEGTIRDRIDNILTSIQKLNQTIAYSTDVQKTEEELDGGGGSSKKRGHQTRGVLPEQQAFMDRTKATSVSTADSRGTSSSSAPVNRSGFTVPGLLSPDEIAELTKSADKAVKQSRSEGLPSMSSGDSSTTSGTSSSGTVPSLIVPGSKGLSSVVSVAPRQQSSKGSTTSIPMKGAISASDRARINQAMTTKVPGFVSPQEKKRMSSVASVSKGARTKSDESGATESKGEDYGDPSRFHADSPEGSIDEEGYYEDLERQLDEAEEADERDDGRDRRYRDQERMYAQSGTKVVSRAPGDVRVTSKIKSLIDNSLASILSGYNSLVDYVKLQQQQRPFSSKDTQVVSGLLQTLVEPLKQVIVSALSLRYTNDGKQTVEGQIEYTRVYNVLKDIIQKIQDSSNGGPLIKTDPGMLTEKIPLRQDIMDAPDYDAFNVNTYPYLDKLNDMIETERTKVEAYKVHSQLERDGQQQKLSELDKVQQSLERAGYPTTERARKLFIEKTKQRIKDIVSKSIPVEDTLMRLKDDEDTNRKALQKQIGKFKQTLDEYYVRAPSDAKGNIKQNSKIRKMEKRIEKLQSMIDKNTFQRSHYDEIQSMTGELKALVNTYNKARSDIKTVKKSLKGTGASDFGDDAELEPYLTKHLKPTMKTSLKSGGKKPKAQEPPFQMRKEQDLWFM
jgi:hypothetical protein